MSPGESPRNEGPYVNPAEKGRAAKKGKGAAAAMGTEPPDKKARQEDDAKGKAKGEGKKPTVLEDGARDFKKYQQSDNGIQS